MLAGQDSGFGFRFDRRCHLKRRSRIAKGK
jgi:hypothetical protein